LQKYQDSVRFFATLLPWVENTPLKGKIFILAKVLVTNLLTTYHYLANEQLVIWPRQCWAFYKREKVFFSEEKKQKTFMY
jgi:hypothetical protein